jgi:magnesium-transporting ATPase (P-type)
MLLWRRGHRYQLMDEIEKNLEVMGVTAIEDKLQDGVPETLSALREAGVKVWMLTGDKVDTAINIGYSCSLLATEMTVLRLCGEDGDMELDPEKVPLKESIEGKMRATLAECQAQSNAMGNFEQPSVVRALVVDTYALAAILKYELQGLLVQICRKCKSVICARVSPKQKAKVVEMVKHADPTVQTVAIGDGANDVPMIQTAHVGIGIHGLEGQQAVNNSDYAIGQFRFLRDLLLVHGRWNYRRTSKVVSYIFYKNALLVLPQFFFGMFSMYSGQNFYFDGFYQLYNVIYTAFPIIALGVSGTFVPRGTLFLFLGPLSHHLDGVHVCSRCSTRT